MVKAMENGIAFLIAFEQKPHAGVVRPFINWTMELKENNNDVACILFKCRRKLGQKIKATVGNVDIVETNKMGEIIEHIKNARPRLMIGDDYYPRLKLLTEIKRKTSIKTAIYVMVLYGIHSVARVFSYRSLPLKTRLSYEVASILPFKWLTENYVRHLKNQDIIIPVSKTTAAFLQALYGVKSNCVVYPPVNTDVFKPSPSARQLKEVLLYLGSEAGDTREEFTERIVEIARRKGFAVNLLGNKKLAVKLRRKFEGLIYHFSLSDMELASVYSRNLITICPQEWEQFGYVCVESMACGTPVLAFNYFGPSESITGEKTGWLADNESDFLGKLSELLSEGYPESMRTRCRRRVVNNFSTETSLKKLIESIKAR